MGGWEVEQKNNGTNGTRGNPRNGESIGHYKILVGLARFLHVVVWYTRGLPLDSRIITSK